MRLTGWHDRASYGTFLQTQYAARFPIERWVETSCPKEHAPPQQSHLIARDLADLGLSTGEAQTDFALPDGADPLGLAWAIAGSSLGNRAIMHEMKRNPGDVLPTRFLADPSMIEFWQSLRGRLEQTVPYHAVPASTLAARAVFEHFRMTMAALAPNGTRQ